MISFRGRLQKGISPIVQKRLSPFYPPSIEICADLQKYVFKILGNIFFKNKEMHFDLLGILDVR